MAMAWTNLSQLHLSHTPIAFSEVTGKGKEKNYFRLCSGGRSHQIFRRRCRCDLAASYVAEAQTEGRKKEHSVYETLERPLVMVLADMEQAGITIDPDSRQAFQ